MLQIQQISFKYGRKGKQVFTDFSLLLEPGKIYGLLGKNGTGKSTLLYMCSGLLAPQTGEVLYEEQTVAKRSPEFMQEIFLIPEEVYLPDISMKEYVRTMSPFYPRFSSEILQDCLGHFGLKDHIPFASLSMGERKKMYVSFALATQSRILLMDEPTNGLDIPSKSIFRKVVTKHMTDDRIMVISSHQVGDIDMLLDHVVLLEESRLLLSSPINAICDKLCFSERPMGAPTEDVLYMQPSISGISVMTLRQEGEEETPVNLELLFNSAIAGKIPESLLSHS